VRVRYRFCSNGWGFTSDFDANGEGEVVGGIVVMRYGENADKAIDAKLKNERSRKDCLKVTFKTSYDRSELIKSIESVKGTLIEEMIAVSIVTFLFPLEKCLNYSNTATISAVIGFILLQAFAIYYVAYRNCFLAIGVVVDD
jgi:Cu(I)/Ag(I) efflux system membrane protein CusA/SilA